MMTNNNTHHSIKYDDNGKSLQNCPECRVEISITLDTLNVKIFVFERLFNCLESQHIKVYICIEETIQKNASNTFTNLVYWGNLSENLILWVTLVFKIDIWVASNDLLPQLPQRLNIRRYTRDCVNGWTFGDTQEIVSTVEHSEIHKRLRV